MKSKIEVFLIIRYKKYTLQYKFMCHPESKIMVINADIIHFL